MGLHGKPDWGLQLKSTVYSMDDLAELAVRLGSISRFDRRGDIICYDNFEGGSNKVALTGTGDDNQQLIVSDMVNSGGYSLKLIGGSTSTKMAQATKYLPYSVLSKFGFEFAFTSPVDITSFQIAFYVYKEGERLRGEIYYVVSSNDLFYWGSDGAWHLIDGDVKFYVADYLFNVFKLVVDGDNEEYCRCIINNTTFDLTDIALYSETAVIDPHLRFMIYIYSDTDKNGYMYFDDIIITQNEP